MKIFTQNSLAFFSVVEGIELVTIVLFALQVVHEEFGIVEGLMTTVHATTGRFDNKAIHFMVSPVP